MAMADKNGAVMLRRVNETQPTRATKAKGNLISTIENINNNSHAKHSTSPIGHPSNFPTIVAFVLSKFKFEPGGAARFLY